MLVRGKTLDEIRNCVHPFGHALGELYEICDLVCSAPMGVSLTDEHAGVDGSLMLVAQLPLRVYVGMIGRNVSLPGQLPPIVSSVRYYDPLSDTLEERSHHPEYLGAEENVRNIGKLLVEIAKEQHFKFLPAELVILSEAPPGRGANWSGAFAAATALSLYLLQGKDFPAQLHPHYWKNTTQIPKRDGEIENLFRMALRIECASHGLTSGYGPACSLLPARGMLFLYKSFIDPKFAATREDPRRNLSFFLCHWDTYQQRLATGKKHTFSEVYDLLVVDSGRSKSTCDCIGRVRGVEEDKIAQDLINLLASDPNPPHDALVKSNGLLDQLLYARRAGLSILGMLSTLAIKTLRDCCGGIENPQATLRIISNIDHMLQQLGLSFTELDALRKDLEAPLQREELAITFTGGGSGGDMLIWGIPEAINAIEMSTPSEKVQPTLVWQLSRDGLAQEGAICNHPCNFQPFSRRASSSPAPRNPVPHQAVSIDAHGNVTLLPAVPASLFDVHLTLRRLLLQGECLYMYSYNDISKDRFEPLYLTWPTQKSKGVSGIQASPFHPKEGFVLLKDLLLAFAREGRLWLDNPDPLLEPGGRLRSTAMIDLDLARGALNFEANRLERQERHVEFPHLRVQRLTNDTVRVSLKIPANAHFFVVYPFSEREAFESLKSYEPVQASHAC